jgi:hypothetical protein
MGRDRTFRYSGICILKTFEKRIHRLDILAKVFSEYGNSESVTNTAYILDHHAVQTHMDTSPTARQAGCRQITVIWRLTAAGTPYSLYHCRMAKYMGLMHYMERDCRSRLQEFPPVAWFAC